MAIDERPFDFTAFGGEQGADGWTTLSLGDSEVSFAPTAGAQTECVYTGARGDGLDYRHERLGTDRAGALVALARRAAGQGPAGYRPAMQALVWSADLSAGMPRESLERLIGELPAAPPGLLDPGRLAAAFPGARIVPAGERTVALFETGRLTFSDEEGRSGAPGLPYVLPPGPVRVMLTVRDIADVLHSGRGTRLDVDAIQYAATSGRGPDELAEDIARALGVEFPRGASLERRLAMLGLAARVKVARGRLSADALGAPALAERLQVPSAVVGDAVRLQCGVGDLTVRTSLGMSEGNVRLLDSSGLVRGAFAGDAAWAAVPLAALREVTPVAGERQSPARDAVAAECRQVLRALVRRAGRDPGAGLVRLTVLVEALAGRPVTSRYDVPALVRAVP